MQRSYVEGFVWTVEKYHVYEYAQIVYGDLVYEYAQIVYKDHVNEYT